ncbi:hypothetical protein WH47_05103 [Habropoda laboriosa]|uniref:Regulatory protein zeste n=1 Tax=Habropoda laboriosa TaxID=597456 RepID=A0A0L7QSH3_9HYME|nr:hypothetical protein WH47_05103 [Habropoda laboriosa]
MPRNLPEVDRKKNQFDKDERVHLLAIMKRYAPLLDNSTSTLARKKIWTTIEDEFKKAGFTRKTSAQLKKYWQNYKYHCKKASTAFGKEKKRYIDSEVSDSLEWNRYQVFVENRSVTKFSEIPGVTGSLLDRFQRLPVESGEIYRDNDGSSWKFNTSDALIDLSRVKIERNDDETASNDCKVEESNPLEGGILEEYSMEEKKEIFAREDHLEPPSSVVDNAAECKTKNRIVVSNANISNNSVTVSIVYPENDKESDRRFSTVEVESNRADNEEYRLSEFSKEEKGVKANSSGSTRNYVFLADYHNRLKHRLLLQQLETEEKRLKVKIAEMAVQEVELRIKGLSEDMRRTEELHQLRLARAAAGNVNVG